MRPRRTALGETTARVEWSDSASDATGATSCTDRRENNVNGSAHGFEKEEEANTDFNIDTRIHESVLGARNDSRSIAASENVCPFAILIEFGEEERSIAENDRLERWREDVLLLKVDFQGDKRAIAESGEKDCHAVRERSKENGTDQVGRREGLSRADGEIGNRQQVNVLRGPKTDGCEGNALRSDV